jgi:hypothetical protein
MALLCQRERDHGGLLVDRFTPPRSHREPLGQRRLQRHRQPLDGDLGVPACNASLT